MKRYFLVGIVALITTVFIVVQDSYGLDRFGLIFDIQGEGTIKGANGKTVVLDKASHILRPFREGDVIEVAKGKVLIVAEQEGKAYEILSNSSARIKDNKMVKIKGDIKLREGLGFSPGAGSEQIAYKPFGAIVFRGKKSCIKAKSPINTAILELTPELKWTNECGGPRKVNIKILSDKKVIYSADSEGTAVKVADGLLSYGREYRWIIDSGSSGISGGVFSIPNANEVTLIRGQLTSFKKDSNNVYQRLNIAFYLLSKGLNEAAKTEIDALRTELPDNPYLRQLSEEGTIEDE